MRCWIFTSAHRIKVKHNGWNVVKRFQLALHTIAIFISMFSDFLIDSIEIPACTCADDLFTLHISTKQIQFCLVSFWLFNEHRATLDALKGIDQIELFDGAFQTHFSFSLYMTFNQLHRTAAPDGFGTLLTMFGCLDKAFSHFQVDFIEYVCVFNSNLVWIHRSWLHLKNCTAFRCWSSFESICLVFSLQQSRFFFSNEFSIWCN